MQPTIKEMLRRSDITGKVGKRNNEKNSETEDRTNRHTHKQKVEAKTDPKVSAIKSSQKQVAQATLISKIKHKSRKRANLELSCKQQPRIDNMFRGKVKPSGGRLGEQTISSSQDKTQGTEVGQTELDRTLGATQESQPQHNS